MEGEYLEDVTDFRALVKQVQQLNPRSFSSPGTARIPDIS